MVKFNHNVETSSFTLDVPQGKDPLKKYARDTPLPQRHAPEHCDDHRQPLAYPGRDENHIAGAIQAHFSPCHSHKLSRYWGTFSNRGAHTLLHSREKAVSQPTAHQHVIEKDHQR